MFPEILKKEVVEKFKKSEKIFEEKINNYKWTHILITLSNDDYVSGEKVCVVEGKHGYTTCFGLGIHGKFYPSEKLKKFLKLNPGCHRVEI